MLGLCLQAAVPFAGRTRRCTALWACLVSPFRLWCHSPPWRHYLFDLLAGTLFCLTMKITVLLCRWLSLSLDWVIVTCSFIFNIIADVFNSWLLKYEFIICHRTDRTAASISCVLIIYRAAYCSLWHKTAISVHNDCIQGA